MAKIAKMAKKRAVCKTSLMKNMKAKQPNLLNEITFK